MAETTETTETSTYQLSTIDQSIIRTYIRCCLCFPCKDDKAVRDQVVDNLMASTKRAISYMPILAGDIHSVENDNIEAKIVDRVVAPEELSRRASIQVAKDDKQQHGRVEVRVTLAQVNGFEPTIQILDHDDFEHTYEELSAAKMEANAFIGDVLTPLPDSPNTEDEDDVPAFAVQANFIQGGVLVCLYLHHSVADVKGLAAIIRHMSISKERQPGVQHTLHSLQEDTVVQSRTRDRLSGSRGTKPELKEHPEYQVGQEQSLAPSHGTSRVFAFSLEMLNGTRDMINERLQYTSGEPETHLSAFDCLAAVLWKAITRARWPAGTRTLGEKSQIFVPAEMAKRVDPELPEQFYGNSCLFSVVKEDLIKLTLPFDVSSLTKVTRMIRERTAKMNDAKARSAIAIINDCEDVTMLNHPNIDFVRDVFITNWANLPIDEESTLGLGLGAPEWTRKVSRSHSAYGCVLLPLKKEQGVWEVTVSLAEAAMERLLDDPGLKPFVVHVA